MCSRYEANTSGRTILAPGNVYTNELVYNDVLFNPTPVLDDYGGHCSSDPSRTLDCGYKRRPQYSFKFACNGQNCGAGAGAGMCNCFDPAKMAWAQASMGVPRVNARFDRYG